MRCKYPKTLHLPWSEGLTNDDRLLESTEVFVGQDVVVTEKLDGENTTMYSDHIHARSIDSKSHPSRGWVRSLHSQIQVDIPVGWRICGENLYAKHSIRYDVLPTYFLVFSVWNEQNWCLSWDETKETAALLGLQTVPELYVGKWDEAVIKTLFTGMSRYGLEQEGYVVRICGGFSYDEFQWHVAKFVRARHVQTDENWMYQPVIPNGVKS